MIDFSSVNNVDATSVQALIDVRNQLDRYASPDTVDWHFANITNRWAKRGLAAGGFGVRRTAGDDEQGQAIFSIAELLNESGVKTADSSLNEKRGVDDIENLGSSEENTPLKSGAKQVVLQGLNRPLFHFDLQEAVEAAVLDARTKTY